jgi:hypothetical protein
MSGLLPEAAVQRTFRNGRFVPIADLPGSIRVFAVYPTNQSSRHFEPMRQPSEGSVVVLYRPCLIRETQLELERRSCQSCSEVRRKLMRSMSSRY